MTEILHGVNIEGSFANTVAPRSVVDVMYPVWESEVEGGVYIGTEVEVNGVSMQPFNSILKFNPLKKALYITTPDTDGSGIGVVEGDMVAISGNTVTRLCPVAKDCGSCALSGSGMTIAEKLDSTPFNFNGSQLFVSAAYGYYLVRSGDDAESALASADMSMYVDKRRNKGVLAKA